MTDAKYNHTSFDKLFKHFDLTTANGSQEEKDEYAAFIIDLAVNIEGMEITDKLFQSVLDKTGTSIPKLKEYMREAEHRITLYEKWKQEQLKEKQ
jgi:hypothetical protein